MLPLFFAGLVHFTGIFWVDAPFCTPRPRTFRREPDGNLVISGIFCIFMPNYVGPARWRCRNSTPLPYEESSRAGSFYLPRPAYHHYKKLSVNIRSR